MSVSSDDWYAIREKCFDIETDEACDADYGNAGISKRGAIAASIADIRFSELFKQYDNEGKERAIV
jgi:hypothetical protein